MPKDILKDVPENIHAEHRKRVREEFEISGFNSETPPHKIVEMMLFYSIPRKDTNTTAHLLMNEFGSVAELIDARPEDIMKVKGAGQSTATFLKFIRFIANYYANEKKKSVKKFFNFEEMGDFLQTKYIGINNEVIAITSLDNAGGLLGFDVIGEGDISFVGISSRQVIETVLKRKAKMVVLTHNHPKGQALPSSADIEATKTLRDILKSVDVKLLDHIIIVDDDYLSLRVSHQYSYIFNDEED